MRILLLAAFQDELTTLTTHFTNLEKMMISKCKCFKTQWHNHEMIISLTGIGTSASAIITTILCEALKPDLIIFCGVAGGLLSDQQIGDLILATKILDADLYRLPAMLENSPYQNALIDPHTQTYLSTEYTPHDSIMDSISTFSFERLQKGFIVTSNSFPAPQHIFSEIRRLGFSAIEMEGSGVAKAAQYYDIPVIMLRAISNLLDEMGNDLGTRPNALKYCANRLALCVIELLHHLSNTTITAQAKKERCDC